jgi:hypothetical protein
VNEDFQIKDRRRLDVEGNIKQEYSEEPKSQPIPEQKLPEQKLPEPEAQPSPSNESDFISFLMNISSMAYSAMGLGPDSTGISLHDAKYLIDVIGVLEEKTKGNLTPEEEQALRSLLYELRMNFARVTERVRPK